MPLFASDPSAKPATEAQINFLEILFNDLGYTRKQRNARLTDDLGREIKFLDNLTIPEASRLIETLKEEKEDGREDDYEPDPYRMD